jgi:hypothetical protein
MATAEILAEDEVTAPILPKFSSAPSSRHHWTRVVSKPLLFNREILPLL